MWVKYVSSIKCIEICHGEVEVGTLQEIQGVSYKSNYMEISETARNTTLEKWTKTCARYCYISECLNNFVKAPGGTTMRYCRIAK